MSNARFENALKRRPQNVPPIWMMRQAGRYHKHYQKLRAKHSFMELCKRPELAAQVALGPIEDFDFDAAILFSDLLFPLEALGMGLEYTDRGPMLEWRLAADTMKKIGSADAAVERLQFQKEAMRLTRQALPASKSLIGFVGGPWTLFSYAVQGKHEGGLKETIEHAPALYGKFCEKMVPLLIENIQLQFDGGAEIVMIFDTAAGELDARSFNEWNKAPLARLVSAHPGKLGYYSRGTGIEHLKALKSLAWAGLGVDHRWNFGNQFSFFEKGFVQGNFNQFLLKETPPAEFRSCLIQYLKPILEVPPSERTGWICGLGHGVLPQTPEGNVRAFVEIVRDSFFKGGTPLNRATLMKKYDIPAPRYTSYPTVPYWETSPTTEQWLTELQKAFNGPSMSWSLYLHIPFCETLCTFCGCNTTITKDHTKEENYISLLHAEWRTYKTRIKNLTERPLFEIHLGGGTPTFLSAQHLVDSLTPILNDVKKDPKGFEGSIEVDPRRTSVEQLKALADLGFTRVSMGVQDFNPEVQRLVNRIQPFEVTENLTKAARSLGFKSVNFDLIYGLPKQNLEGMKETVRKTVSLMPDRIALYSYAHVPWIKPAQRLFTEKDLPAGEEKRELYESACDILSEAGYVEIGMDHFALKTDSLYRADVNHTLHRNFMGYTSRRTDVLLGLGVSSISEAPTCFHQNEKVLPVYDRRTKAGEIPTLRGHLLTEEDRAAREQILQLMTQWHTHLEEHQRAAIAAALAPLIEDGLVEIQGHVLKMTEKGKPFLRIACMALDRRLLLKAPQTKLFSQAL